MSKIGNAFKTGKAFIGFLTAGDPSLDKTYEYIMTMEKAGADLIEIGIPFSDPIAEGIVIQEADLRALKAGTRIDDVFALVERVRKETQIPLVFLTYLNPVFHYGAENSLPAARKRAWTVSSSRICLLKNAMNVPLLLKRMASTSFP